MASPLGFVTEVPFTEGFDTRQRREDERALNQARLSATDWALRESMRKSEEAQGTDTAQRAAVKESIPTIVAPSIAPPSAAIPPTPAGIDPAAHAQVQAAAAREAGTMPTVAMPPVPAQQPTTARAFRTNLAKHLATVQGGGAAAAQHLQGAMESQEAKEEKFLEMAIKNPDQAEQFAAMSGLQVDQNMRGLIRNRKAMASIAGLLDASKTIYPGEQNAAVRAQWLQQQLGRLSEMAQSASGVNQADLMMGAADLGMPEPKVKRQYAPYPVTIQDDQGNPSIGVFDPETSTISGTGQRGYGRYGGTQQQGSMRERVIEQLRKENPNLTYAEALALSIKAPSSSAEEIRRENLALQAAKNELGFRTNPTGTLEKWRKYYGLRGIAPDYQGAKTQIPPTAAPQAPVPPGTPIPPAAVPQTYDDGEIQGTFTGRYSNGKPVYQTKDGRPFVTE